MFFVKFLPKLKLFAELLMMLATIAIRVYAVMSETAEKQAQPESEPQPA
jgi:hypothetical protein